MKRGRSRPLSSFIETSALLVRAGLPILLALFLAHLTLTVFLLLLFTAAVLVALRLVALLICHDGILLAPELGQKFNHHSDDPVPE